MSVGSAGGDSVARRQAITAGLGSILLGALLHGSEALARPAPQGLNLTADGGIKIKALHVFDGVDGQTQIDTIEFSPIRQKILEDIGLAETTGHAFANLFESKASEVHVTAAPSGYFIDWHHAVRRHFFFTIQGIWETGLADGSLHRVGPGQFLLAEDRKGRGHTSRVVSKEWAVALDVILEG